MNVSLHIENLEPNILYAIAALVSSFAAYSVRVRRHKNKTKEKGGDDEDSRV